MTSTNFDWTDLQRDSLERALKRNVQGAVLFDQASRILYSNDASHYQLEPVGVVVPKTQTDLQTAVAIAAEQRVPIVPRGGGTSLSGQSIGLGLIIDCSKHLNQVVDVNSADRSAVVEPGIVSAHLNARLRPLGLQFGPDVATIDRACLGGMIGNNSAGARSIRYGKTVDNVASLDVVLSNGRRATFGPNTQLQLQRILATDGLEGRIYRTVVDVVAANGRQIEQRFPKILRRVSGYNLDALHPLDDVNLAKLIVGSEGTLAVVSRAQLKLVPVPKARGVAAVPFGTLAGALQGLNAILDTKPSAVELLDAMIIHLARQNPEFRASVDFVEGRPEALFIVEYIEDSDAAVDERFVVLKRSLGEATGIGRVVASRDEQLCRHIWDVRKTALPLLHALPGRRKPVTFVEDTAVDPQRLPEFVARFREILQEHGTDGSFYGHASVGCLHIRPLLDLHSKDDLDHMRVIAQKVVALVQEFGGAMSGEHGDGLARSCFNREIFGDDVYAAFQKIKQAFDPYGLMNPGKIVDAQPMTENLRPEPAASRPAGTTFHYADPLGIADVAGRCNGNALCRRVGTGTMCPSFMAVREEQHSPRGRANLLRAAFSGNLITSQGADSDWASRELDEALDLCLMCKACKTECPSAVDVARMKSEYLHHRHRHRLPSLRTRMTARVHESSRLGSRLAPFSNWMLRSTLVKFALDWFVGIDCRRALPTYARTSLASWFARHESECVRARGKVVLLADCFTNYHQPKIGRAAVTLLERAGYQVFLAPLCCGRVLISKGFLDDAKQLVMKGLKRLQPYVEDGYAVLGVEPSCLFSLVDEWTDLCPGDLTARLARQAQLVEVWLAERAAWGASELSIPSNKAGRPRVLLHGHCHQRAASALTPAAAALEKLANIKVDVLDSGCCGMAGAFGYEKEHYEVSVNIAEQRLLPTIRSNRDVPILAPGFSCRSQISDLAGIKPYHPLEMILERLSQEPET